MKKLVVLLLIVGLLFTVGCSKEWMAHDTVYKTNDHLAFSLWGYQDANAEDMATQDEQGGWWGDPISMEAPVDGNSSVERIHAR